MKNEMFEESSLGAREDLCEREAAIREGFEHAMTVLEEYREKYGTEYAVVGGCALKAHMGEEIALVRSDGTVRDIDVIILHDPQGRGQDLVETLRAIDHADIGVTLPQAKDSHTEGHQIFRQIVCDDQGRYYLVFRDIRMEVDDTVMKTERIKVDLAGMQEHYDLRTFSPGTLLHLYLTRIGMLKPKDISKIRHFARTMKRAGQLPLGPDHAPYRTFHTFAHEMRTRYKLHNVAVKAFLFLDQVCHGALNHAAVVNVALVRRKK